MKIVNGKKFYAQDNCALDFVAHMLAGRETVPESMTADTLRKVAAFAAEQAERIV